MKIISEDKLLAEMHKGSRLVPAPEDAQVLPGHGEGCHAEVPPGHLLTAVGPVGMRTPPEDLQAKPIWEVIISLYAAAMWRLCPSFIDIQSSATKDDGCSSHKILNGNLPLSFVP